MNPKPLPPPALLPPPDPRDPLTEWHKIRRGALTQIASDLAALNAATYELATPPRVDMSSLTIRDVRIARKILSS